MRDFYKRLGISEGASEREVRTALAAADPATREAGELVLLDPRRREVYDRNRRVLGTIGRLRANLGLNLTRFWPRARFADFTHELAPAVTHNPGDPMAMAWAFGVRPPASRRSATRVSGITVVAAVLCAVASAVAVWWWLRAAGVAS